MGTSFSYYQVLILLIPWISNSLNTYRSDGDTYWQSNSTFVPKGDSAYGTIRLRQRIQMSLHFQWNGRTSPTLIYEQIFRVGWASTSGSCSGQNSRYPSLWIDNTDDLFHLSISQDGSCGQGWRISSYPLRKHQIYAVYIEFTDTNVFMSINDTVVLSEARMAPTNPSFIGKLMNVYIASDHWNDPYIIADASLSNIHIASLLPPTNAPTMRPTRTPSSNPTRSPITIAPTTHPTHRPSRHPTTRPTRAPSTTTTRRPTRMPSQRPAYSLSSPTTEHPTYDPTHKPTMPSVSLIQSTRHVHPTKHDYILPPINASVSLDFVANQEPKKKEINMTEILYLLIAGIASCLLGTLLIFITVKKCGDIRDGNALSAQRLGLALRKCKVHTEDSFSKSKHKVCVPLKPAKEPDMLKLAPPHPVPAPCGVADKYVITVSNAMESVYDVVDEGNETSNDTQNETETENETQIMGIECGIDGMIDETETILTRTESMTGLTMSPSHVGSRLNTTMRKYLMSESHEEEYIKNVMEQAVVIHHPKKRGKNGLLVINDCEDGEMDGKRNEFNHSEDMIEILDEDNSDDETLPVLPGTCTTGTANDGESVTMDYRDYNLKPPPIHLYATDVDGNDGYTWITKAMMQIDTQDWRLYVENFQRNKVNESRLCDLKRSDLKELIPKIGPRNEFERLLREKLGTEPSETTEY
eukprot:163309_1